MALYEVTFEAEVSVIVEASNKEDAEQKAKISFRWTDVKLLDMWDIVNLSGSEDTEE